MAQNPRSIAVIGLGSFGSSVALELTRFGDRVLGIDTSAANVARFSDTLHRTVIADSRDERAMAESGLGSYDAAIIAMASDLESSILSCMNARQLGVPEIWAKAGSSTHARILESIGVDRILQPEHEFGEHIAHLLHNSAIQNYIRLSPSLHLASIRTSAKRIGQPLDGIKLLHQYELHCLGLIRGGHYMKCGSEVLIAENDALLLMGTRENMRIVAERL